MGLDGPPAESYENAPPDIVMRGYLTKKCGGFTSWATRYLILDKPRLSLFYYHKPTDDSPRGTIDLNSYRVSWAEPRETRKGQPGLRFLCPNAKTYIFCSSDRMDIDIWFREINDALTGRSRTQIGGGLQIGIPQMQPGDMPQMSPNGMMQNDPMGMGGQPPGMGPPGFGMPPQGPPGMPPGFGGVPPPPNPYHPPNLPGMPPPPNLPGMPLPPPGMPPPPGMSNLPPLPPGMRPPNFPLPPGARPPPGMLQQRDDTLVNQTQLSQLAGGPPAFRPRPPAPPPEPASSSTTTVTTDKLQNVTLIPGASPQPQAKSTQPDLIPHITMIPDNAFFPVVERDVSGILKIGRISSSTEANTDSEFIGFKSKVVSRTHAEIWTVNGEFYIRDTKSQSGTFLNAMRLSEPGKESKPFKLHDGDIVQFGVDFRGSEENEAKCVSMKVQLKMIPGKKAKSDGPSASGTEKTIIGSSGAGVTLIPGGKTVVPGQTTTNGRTVVNKTEKTLFNGHSNTPPIPEM